MDKTFEKNQTVERFPLMPLRGMIVFPNTVISLDVGRRKSMVAIQRALENERRLFVVAQRDAMVELPELKDMHTVGTVVYVRQVLNLPDGNLRILVEGQRRAALVGVTDTGEFQLGDVMALEAVPAEKDNQLRARMRLLRRNVFRLAQARGILVSAELSQAVNGENDPDALCDIIASNMLVDLRDKQAILETTDVARRLESLFEMLLNEHKLTEIEEKINLRVRENVEKNNQDYYLREQVRLLQEELGQDEDDDIRNLRKRLKESPISGEARERTEKELSKLARTSAQAPESAVMENYIEYMLDLPWAKEEGKTIDLARARKIFERDHFGMREVKDRLLEHLAVLKKKGDMKSPILCLVGPPGVGKTSIARSVAEALDRKFAQMSLGGVHDEAEIRGHRRTYIAAMPGRILSAIRHCGTNSPVFLLDEVDKLAHDMRGDPASALLEVLDPEQNSAFRDHYVEAPFDLSNVLFITTANTTDTIDRALLDRMEVIEVPSYTLEEKVKIAKKYLLPKQLKNHALKREQVRVNDRVLARIIDGYTREAGVRQLERMIGKLCRKCVLKLDEDASLEKLSVTLDNLNDLLGTEKFVRTDENAQERVGRIKGLAWTQVGGEVLPIEALVMEGKGDVKFTGQLGDVMRESCDIALSVVRARMDKFGVEADFFKKHDLHIHAPEGATPKDGPSAGVAIACAVMSAVSGVPARGDVAMTGEVTLLGDVLPIGGVKEKLLAAYRLGVKNILLPKENMRDLEKIDRDILEKLNVMPMENVEKAFDTVLTGARCAMRVVV